MKGSVDYLGGSTDYLMNLASGLEWIVYLLGIIGIGLMISLMIYGGKYDIDR